MFMEKEQLPLAGPIYVLLKMHTLLKQKQEVVCSSSSEAICEGKHSTHRSGDSTYGSEDSSHGSRDSAHGSRDPAHRKSLRPQKQRPRPQEQRPRPHRIESPPTVIESLLTGASPHRSGDFTHRRKVSARPPTEAGVSGPCRRLCL